MLAVSAARWRAKVTIQVANVEAEVAGARKVPKWLSIKLAV
jgi:hypothetical protein